ncbi:MAG: bile acid:sodium symporter family protein, partial [Owenweeksia sp.]
YKTGFILIAACPGGTVSNLITYFLKGRIALSVSLTAFNSLLVVFTVPVILNIAMDTFSGSPTGIEISFSEIFINMLGTVIAPVLAGMILNEKGPEKIINAIKKPLRYILMAILLLIFILVSLSKEGGQSFDFNQDYILIFPGVILNITTMMAGFFISGYAGVTHRGRYTIAIEMGLQNVALAIFIATTLLENDQMALVAVLYSSTSFATTWLVAWLLKRREPEEEED